MTPSGTIYLLSNVPLNSAYEHTIDFTNSSEQWGYFTSKIVKTVEDTQCVRKARDNIIVPFLLDDIRNVNYVIYRSMETSKLIYCFVTRKDYLDGNTQRASTVLTLEIDVLQTYMFDYKFNPSYIAREHSDRWDKTYNPIFSVTDEGLDYGNEYITEKAYKVDNAGLEWVMVVLKVGESVVYKDSENRQVKGEALNNYITCLVPLSMADIKNRVSRNWSFITSDTEQQYNIHGFHDLMYMMSTTALGEHIVEMTHCPYVPFKVNVSSENVITVDGAKAFCVYHKESSILLMAISTTNSNVSLTSFDYLHGLTRPKKATWDKVRANPLRHTYDKQFESKLLSYPYRYNLLTNWKDNPVVFKNEHLPKTCTIKMNKAFGFNAPCRYWIKDYKFEEFGRSNSLVETASTDFPIVSSEYASYMYNNKNTLKQNQVNQAVSIATTAGTSFATGGLAGGILGTIGAVSSSYQTLASENAKQKDIALLPVSYISGYDGSFNLIDENTVLTFYRYRISEKDQERLAWYWHMYGYKSGAIKVPDLHSRNRFNFIQTIGANITGNIDQEDISILKAIFDKGVTFWHYNKTNFYPLDYRYGNYEVNVL